MSEVTYNRVNWKDTPSTETPINATNLNVMDKGIADVAAAVNECFQSASEGKTLIAAALTGKGQTSTAADTFAQMAAKIGNLMAVPTATKTIIANGNNIDVTNYAKVDVNVPAVPQTPYSRSYYLSTPSHGVLHLKVTKHYPWGNQVSFDDNVDVYANPYDDGYFRTSRLANARWYYLFRVVRKVDGVDSFLDTNEQILWPVDQVGNSITFNVPTRD